MPTNEERKQVAARLRELADQNAITATTHFSHELFRELGGEPPTPPSTPTLRDLEAYDQAFLYRLADLIEPEEGDNDVEVLTNIADGLFCDLMDAAPLIAMGWAKVWPELFVKAVNDAD